jgi:hypothetical protein
MEDIDKNKMCYQNTNMSVLGFTIVKSLCTIKIMPSISLCVCSYISNSLSVITKFLRISQKFHGISFLSPIFVYYCTSEMTLHGIMFLPVFPRIAIERFVKSKLYFSLNIKVRIFLFTASRTALGPTQLPIQ